MPTSPRDVFVAEAVADLVARQDDLDIPDLPHDPTAATVPSPGLPTAPAPGGRDPLDPESRR
ncbi:hypothetical protein [Phaeacidiphilus oryzae]|jgi:hypothetical protein|uniref:hypothetical protein n=1 Tax=Phaeacidiphilus oryzae TaxID=348818 RepID=UPI0006900DA7|nr:hypothetical protein [Phaeacidiphilus oryzae]